jgi:hypothetical protein
MQTAQKLVRKQFLIYPDQVKKLELLAQQEDTSAADMVRKAIDAYNPDIPADVRESELLDLVAAKVKEALADTQKTRKALSKTITKLKTK